MVIDGLFVLINHRHIAAGHFVVDNGFLKIPKGLKASVGDGGREEDEGNRGKLHFRHFVDLLIKGQTGLLKDQGIDYFVYVIRILF